MYKIFWTHWKTLTWLSYKVHTKYYTVVLQQTSLSTKIQENIFVAGYVQITSSIKF